MGLSRFKAASFRRLCSDQGRSTVKRTWASGPIASEAGGGVDTEKPEVLGNQVGHRTLSGRLDRLVNQGMAAAGARDLDLGAGDGGGVQRVGHFCSLQVFSVRAKSAPPDRTEAGACSSPIQAAARASALTPSGRARGWAR